jgi:delta-aminolevulinic acid dehydratase/porphobilinogen synthase
MQTLSVCLKILNKTAYGSRPRRLRRDEFTRAMVREHRLHPTAT